MGSADEVSLVAGSNHAHDSVIQAAVDGMAKKDGLEVFQRLVVPRNSDAQTSISFGRDNVFVIANIYGEVLRLSRGSAKPPAMSPEIMCLNARMFPSDSSHQWRGEGLGICLAPFSSFLDSIKPSIAWVNGRWPYITYAMDEVVVSVLLVIENGILSQQTSIANPSGQPQQITFSLPTRWATTNTLKAGDEGWGSDKDDAWQLPRKEKDSSDIVVGDKPKAIISVFHNGQQLNLHEDVFMKSIYHNEFRPGSQPSAGGLLISPNTEQRLVVHYKLGPDPIGIPQPQPIAHMQKFLEEDQIGDWYFVKGDTYGPIFRRYLEHILHSCLVNFAPDSDHGPRIPFLNDVTFKSRSTPAGDLHMFRYLLMMHQVLKRDDLVCAHPVQIPGTLDHDRSLIRDRIKKACQGHLRWSFDEETMLATYSWPLPRSERGVESARATSREEAFAGSLQILKLTEYADVFGVVGEEKVLVNRCLKLGGLLWLKSLLAGRDEKSKLWYKYKKTYIAWEGRSNEGFSELDLPEYRLGDLIYIWKAIKSLENLIMKDGIDGDIAEKLQLCLTKNRLQHQDVRITILQRFMYHNPQAQSDQRVHETTLGEHGQDQSNHGVHETTFSLSGQEANYITIAVRRSRARDRLLFYAKDTLLYDGIEWGFFEYDTRFQVLNRSGNTVEANVEDAWKNTLRAQGADQVYIWENTLRFALAIAMAKHKISLDIEKKPEDLERISWDRLIEYVLPDGRFADRLGLRKKQPVSLDSNSRRTVEIPTLLLRLKFESVDCVSMSRFESSVAPSRSNADEGSVVASERSTIASLEELSYYSRYDPAVMKKKRVAMVKMIKNSTEKVDQNNISDPTDRKLTDWMYPFPDYINVDYSYDMDQAWRTWKDELSDHLMPDTQYDLDRDSIEKFKKILDKAIGQWREERSFSWDLESAMVIDIDQLGQGKPKRQKRRGYRDDYWLDCDDLDTRLSQTRREEAARKRFHYLAPLQVQQALILYLATPRSDRHNMARFFHRHGSFTSHLHEDVHPLADLWATELHLSFYSLVKKEQPEDRTALSYKNSNFSSARAERKTVCDPLHWDFPFLVKNVHYQVSTASLSYRIIGDMGDKIWTGYLLAFFSGGSKVVPNPDNNDLDAHDWFKRELKNHQRKLLEPFILTKMAAEVYQNTCAILDAINTWVLPDSGSSSKVARADDRIVDVQRTRSTICTELDSILDRLNRLTKANAICLKLWVGREVDRHHKPRWSEKDELKYRELVDHQNRRALQQITNVADQCQQIQATIDLVKGHGKQMINSIKLAESQAMASNSENIRIFTYATVLFYPLTFVAGLFSMQNAPDRKTTIPFLQGTAIALVLTLLIVSNAETLAWPVRRFRYSLRKAARNKMEKTDNVFPFSWKRTLIRMKESEEKDVLHDGEKPRWHRSHLIYFFFLIIYLFVELPVLRIQLAYESVYSAHHSDTKTLDLVVLAAIQILIAVIVLPLYLPFWVILLVWNCVRWISVVMLKTPYYVWKFLKERTQKMIEKNEKKKVKDKQHAEEVQKGQETRLEAQESQGLEFEEKGQGREKEKKEEESKDQSEKMLEKRGKRMAMEREKRQKLYVSMLLNPPQGLISAIGIIQGRTAKEKPQTTIEQETESLPDENESTTLRHVEYEKESEATQLSRSMAEMEPDKLAKRFARWIIGPEDPSTETDYKWNIFSRRHRPKEGPRGAEQDEQEAPV